jgi:flagellar biosynthetic protein FlhB
MAEQDADRSEQATPHKLEEARKKGLGGAQRGRFDAMAMMAALVLVIQSTRAAGTRCARRWHNSSAVSWPHRPPIGRPDGAAAWMGDLLVAMLSVLGRCFCAGGHGGPRQRGADRAGLHFSSAQAGLRQAQSRQRLQARVLDAHLVRGRKSVVKLVVLSAVVYAALRNLVPGLIGLSGADPRDICAY